MSPALSRLPTLKSRVAPALLDAVDRAAAHTGQSRSSLVREAVVLDLARRGLWPPKVQPDAA